MIDFEALSQSHAEECRQLYEGDFDRVLCFDDRGAFGLIQEAARARIKFRTERGDEIFAEDISLVEMPADTPRVLMNAEAVEEYSELLEEYRETYFFHGTAPDMDTVSVNRERAGLLRTELEIGSKAFELAGAADYGMIFPGEAAA